MRPDQTRLAALAQRGERLRDEQLDRLATERGLTIGDVSRLFGVPRRLLGRPDTHVDLGRR